MDETIKFLLSVRKGKNPKFPKRERARRLDKDSYMRNRSAVEGFNTGIEPFKRVLVRFRGVGNLACIRMVLRILK